MVRLRRMGTVEENDILDDGCNEHKLDGVN
jgi:hypothetical protein